MKTAALVVAVLFSFSATSNGSADIRSNQSVEILGSKIVRGMLESEVRASLPVHCVESDSGTDPSFDYCYVSDDIPPDADGEVTFHDGRVHSATRYWFIPEDSDPLEVLMMLHHMLTRLTGQESAACAKIETHGDQEPAYTIFALPEKVLTIQMHTMAGRKGVLYKESLRVNPVPDSYTARGEKMQGTEWCAYVN